MPAARIASQAVTRHAVERAWKAGLVVGAIEFRPDGTVVVLDIAAVARVPSRDGGPTCDELFGASD